MASAAHTIERVPYREEEDGGPGDPWAILKLKNSAPGVPMSIVIEGAVKCAICDGYSEKLICDDCREAVKLVRAAGNTATLKALIEFASNPAMLAVFERLTEDAVADMMMKRMDDARHRH